MSNRRRSRTGRQIDGPEWIFPVDKSAAAFLWRVVLNPKDKNLPGIADNVSARVTAKIGVDNSHQALFERACPGPVDRPHPAMIKMLAVAFRMNDHGGGGHFYISEGGFWSRWDHARRCIADNRSHGKVQCEPDITDEQAAGLQMEDSLCQAIDAPPDHDAVDWGLVNQAMIIETPVLGFFVLWIFAGLFSNFEALRRNAQLKNIHEYRGGVAPFHQVKRLDKSEEGRLARLYRAGDVIAGNTIIAAHVWIAKDIAREYREQAEFDDLVQEGTFGLYKALRKFDLESGRRFSTVAYRAVKWAIKDYLEKLRRLQRHESTDEITAKGGSAALGLYRSVSVECEIFFD